ncbi:Transmembrane emp24 domain-containing protein 5 [Liparis tanakae]|uniref:Transmembrane emp24 domain-containing protein 5 n=1 Tax=Liparis tanakae TaxID=230148 RepID=A0A4Z2F3Q2_9TELE|nr:Transmembrane emp24 domain-containing protein 5 [Liparis tanakae]
MEVVRALLCLLSVFAALLSDRLVVLASFSQSLDSDFTFTLPAGRKECFYQTMKRDASLELEYQQQHEDSSKDVRVGREAGEVHGRIAFKELGDDAPDELKATYERGQRLPGGQIGDTICCRRYSVRLTDDVGEQQIPPGDKSQQLSDSHIAVQVRRAGFRDPGPKLCVAQPGEDGGHGGDQEGDDDAGSGAVPGHLSRQDVDPGPQGAAHAQGHQVQGGQASVEGGLLALRLHGLPLRQAHQQGLGPRARHAAASGPGWREEGEEEEEVSVV